MIVSTDVYFFPYLVGLCSTLISAVSSFLPFDLFEVCAHRLNELIWNTVYLMKICEFVGNSLCPSSSLQIPIVCSYFLLTI
jgi:hypothetical protein